MKKFLLMFTLVGLVIFGCNYSYARDGITYNDNLTTWTDLNGNSFEYGTITIEHNGNSITMMDRNLGATTNNVNSNRSFGYYYQRGNNYGFSSNLELLRTGENLIDASPYGPGNYYNRAVYNVLPRNTIYAWDRSTIRNDNLRGGSGDDFDNNYLGYPVQNPINRQGPCPEGYHVPSIGERLKVMEWWALYNKLAGYGNFLDYTNNFGRPGLSGGISKFRSDFYIPESKCFYTNRYEYEDFYDIIQENLNFLRTSSPIPYSSGDYTEFGFFPHNTDNRSSRILYLDTFRSSSIGEGRDIAAPIRCFKNPVNSTVNEDVSFSIDIDNTTKVGKTEFVVKVMKDGATFRDYTGTVYIYLTDKYGNTTDEDIYELSDGKNYKFNKSDRGKKTFSVNIEEEGTYVLRINDSSNDDFKGSEIFTVKGNNSNNDNFEFDYSKFNPYYSDEMNKAYQYAYHYGITTVSNIKNADMTGGLNRIAMAKMLSYFAENVLGMDDFDTRRNCEFNDVPTYLDRQYNYGVTKACQLGIMGINMPGNKFYPNGGVTRAEFATALSRLLYGTKDGTDKYYSTHISKLYREGIISNTDPTLKERRGYVMLMLMRSDKNYIPEQIPTAYTYSVNKIDTTYDVETPGCNWLTRTKNPYGYDVDMPNKNWADDVKFVNKAIQDVRDNGQHLVKNYIDEANRVLDSASLTKRDQCRYSLLIDELENQKGYLKSYKTENGKTVVGIDFVSYKEDNSWDDFHGISWELMKNTSTKLRYYTLSDNVKLELLNVNENGYTNESDYNYDRKYVSSWNVRINAFCNYEPVYNWAQEGYNRNEYGRLCTKNMIGNDESNKTLIKFGFDSAGAIDRISGLNYLLILAS